MAARPMTTILLILIGNAWAAAAAVLILLRWAERIAWPWLWVLAPLWLPTAVALAAAPVLACLTLRQPTPD